MNTLNITLSKETKSVALSELAHQNGIAQKEIALAIVIQDHQTVSIVDDLLPYGTENLGAQHNLTFVVGENAQLIYVMNMIPAREDEILLSENNEQRNPKNNSLTKKITVRLAGPYAQATLRCAVLGSQNESLKMTTLQLHEAPNTTSTLKVKTVLDDQATFFCNSMIKIEKRAQQTNAHLENKNILLSHKSRAVSIPQLEIEANEVKCGHGATVSKLNPLDLFYLQSRGIDLPTTKKLLIGAFLNFD